MLDRAEAFALGERDILDGDVVLEIDEGLAAVPSTHHSGVMATGFIVGAWQRRRPGGEATISRSACAGFGAVFEAVRSGSCRRSPRRQRSCRRGAAFGTKAAMSSRHCGLPPRWQVRCSDGFQPPLTREPVAGDRGSSRPSRRRSRPREAPCAPFAAHDLRAKEHADAPLSAERSRRCRRVGA